MKKSLFGAMLAVTFGAVCAFAVNFVQLKPDATLSAPCVVSSAGLSCGRGVAVGTQIIDAVGAIQASTSTTSGKSLRFAGAYSTLPTTGWAEGTLAYQLSDHRLYIATVAVVAAGSWLAL